MSVAHATRAELLRLTRWPALWVMLGVGLALDLLFGYVFDYLGYRAGGRGTVDEGLPPARLLADLLPAAAPETTVQGAPMFGGAILLVVGAVAVGGNFGWSAWKTVFTQAASRVTAYTGTLAALGTVVLALAAASLAANLGVAALIGAAESQPAAWPAAAEAARACGGTALVYAMWAAAGVLAGTLARGPALAVGLGLVWTLAVENALRGAAGVLGPLRAVADVLPGTAAGSLAGALGARPFTQDGGTPGVLDTLDGTTATLLVAAYTVAFAGAAGWLLARRDTT